MGTITKRTTSTGEVRYRALIQIRKQDAKYTESKTFSKKSLAEAWLKKRESEIEVDPGIISEQKKKIGDITLAEAIELYLAEVTNYGRSKKSTLKLLTRFPIAKNQLSTLTRQDYAEHVKARREGTLKEYRVKAIGPATANSDLQYIRTILNHADLVWGLKVNFDELEKASKGLRNARAIGGSQKRFRLPTTEELQKLTTTALQYFYMTQYPDAPIHLIMWFDIYTGRRLTELSRLRIADYDRENRRWLLKSVKNPNGTVGNDKYFVVDERAEKIIDLLLEPELRKRMLKRGGDPEVLIPFSREAIDRNWQKIKDMAGIEDLRFHDLRHEAATRLAEKGMNIPMMQQYTLHEDWNSLKIYVNLNTLRKTVLDFDEAIENAKNAKLGDFI